MDSKKILIAGTFKPEYNMKGKGVIKIISGVCKINNKQMISGTEFRFDNSKIKLLALEDSVISIKNDEVNTDEVKTRANADEVKVKIKKKETHAYNKYDNKKENGDKDE